MKANFWDPSAGLYGLFNLWSFPGRGALVSSALGGGSHIYANVLIRKDERWFEDRAGRGPVTAPISTHTTTGRAPFGRAEISVREHYCEGPRRCAEPRRNSGSRLDLPNLAVSFGKPARAGVPLIEEHPNLHGGLRATCRLCGECDLGCNSAQRTHSISTISPTRKRHGAEIRTLCESAPVREEARKVTSRSSLRSTIQRRPTQLAASVTITANRLILAAGTFGTTFLLMKNRGAFRTCPPALGTRYSGNGDCSRSSQNAPAHEPDLRTVITSAIRHEGLLCRGRWLPGVSGVARRERFRLAGLRPSRGRFHPTHVWGALGLDPIPTSGTNSRSTRPLRHRATLAANPFDGVATRRPER
jgi:cholesterol oxidase